jgi:hypothetical protein
LSQLATRIAKDGTIQNPTQNKTTKDISNE